MIRYSLRAVATLLLAVTAASADGPQKDAAGKPVGRVVHYSGRVQGVGFRATAVKIARDYPVTGRVKNLDDGRVRLVVEGPEAGVKKFLEAVRKRWKDNIEKEGVEEVKPAGKYRDFAV